MKKYLREEIKNFKSYEVNLQDYDIKLDANEGIDWLSGSNRYPDDNCTILREKLADKLSKNPKELLFGNGSSELIELVMKAYLEYGEKVVSFSPTFSLYESYTIINKGLYEAYPLDENMELDISGFIDFIKNQKPKVVIISNPNNPTGAIISREDIVKIVEACDCMVILDEAYIEFSNGEIVDYTRLYKNLLVLRTFSKAYGLAGIRLGYMIGDAETIEYINRVRSPYNINSFTQTIGIKALENEDIIADNIETIKKERGKVMEKLEELGFRTFPSETNFIFFKGDRNLSEELLKRKILIRSFPGESETFYRLTIGKPEENCLAVKAIREVQDEKSKIK